MGAAGGETRDDSQEGRDQPASESADGGARASPSGLAIDELDATQPLSQRAKPGTEVEIVAGDESIPGGDTAPSLPAPPPLPSSISNPAQLAQPAPLPEMGQDETLIVQKTAVAAGPGAVDEAVATKLDSSQVGTSTPSEDARALRELLSTDPPAFEEPAPLDLPPPPAGDGFNPPGIPGIRQEITKPLRTSLSGEPELPNVVAAPESGRRSESTEALLDDLAAPHLGDKTVDIDLSQLQQHTREMAEGPSSTDDSLTIEGAPFEEGTEITALPPPPGDGVASDDGIRIKLEESLGDQRGCVFYRARLEDQAQPFTAVWSPDPRPEPPWLRLPDPRIVRPKARASLEGASIRVFERPKGNTVVDYLTHSEKVLPAMATLELGIELAEILESLHGAGQAILDLDPSQIVIERGGRVRLYAIGGFVRQGEVPPGSVGIFAAPEVRRRYNYLIGQHSDVYSVALMLYALLARRAPIEPDLDASLLAAPRVFRPECPLGIWPYLKPCLHPIPSKRVGHARGLRENLVRARARLLEEARATDRDLPILLESWAETHTGLGKARRGAAQQDRAVALTDDRGTVGLYVVSDGVSRSKYGDGAYAAEQVRISAQQRWQALEKAGPAALKLSHPQRIDVLRQISRSAGKRIANEVNVRCAPMPNEPNQVMSATIVAAYIVGSEATVANLGDSRVYLIRDQSIERISIDHDRATDALRMGLSFREAADVKMGSALTRVVGRVVLDEEGSASPDPFEPEIFRVQLLPGDRLLLCSDGIPDFAAGAGADQYDAELKMLDVVLEHGDPARAAYELVVLANRGGGYDNIGCVVVAAHPDAPEGASLVQKA